MSVVVGRVSGAGDHYDDGWYVQPPSIRIITYTYAVSD